VPALKSFENKALCIIFENKRQELTERYREIHNGWLTDSHSSLSRLITMMNEPRRTTRVGGTEGSEIWAPHYWKK
jgi:hypothetical protein